MRLHYPILHGRYPQGPKLAAALRDVNPAHRTRLITLEAQTFSKQVQSGFGSVAYHPVDSRCVFAPVLLRDAPDGQELIGRGSDEQLLKAFHLPPVALTVVVED